MPTTTMPTTTRAMTMRATMRATRATRAVRARCATGRARDARVSAQMGPELRESIDAFVAEHRVVLFMKGTKDAPRCGFSNTCVQILNSMNVPFADVDILANEDLRQGMKCVGARRRERERERTTSRTTARLLTIWDRGGDVGIIRRGRRFRSCT